MHRAPLCLTLLLAACVAGRGDEERGDELVRALKTRVERVARDARPAIACILVSRSEDYHKAPYWGVPPASPDEPGHLGRFDAAAAARKVPADARNRARVLRTITQHDLSDPATAPESYGSGVVVDRSGLVLTNAHVVKNATKVYVRLPGAPGRGSWADIHASDPRSDLAVLRLLDPPADLEALPIGEGGNVRAGQFVLSIANAYAPGFRDSHEPTHGWGMVRNLRVRAPDKDRNNEMQRHKKTLHHYGTLIQTDAQTTPGCSGGALLDLDGKVIGLTTALGAVRGDQPGGFAIPFDANTRRIVDVLKAGEEVEYGFLGVVLSNERFGGAGPVRLTQIAPGSPAARAGLQQHDTIVTINGKHVSHEDDLFLYVGMTLAGNSATVVVNRHGRPVTHTIKLAKFYVPGPVIASKRPPARFGLRVDHTSVLTQRSPLPPRWARPVGEGVVVREVIADSPADRARLQPDKLITQVNGRAVTTPAEYYQEVARSGKKVELTYLTSDGRPERLTLEEK